MHGELMKQVHIILHVNSGMPATVQICQEDLNQRVLAGVTIQSYKLLVVKEVT
jgi:hypothetical protein